MSYAAAASKGPKQTAEEVRPLSLLPILYREQNLDHYTGSLQHDLLPAQDHYTKARETQKRAPAPPQINPTDSPSTSSLIDVDTPSVHTVSSDFSSQPVQTETQYTRLEHEAEAVEARAREVAHKFAEEEKKAAANARKGVRKLGANGDNPVAVGNAIAVVALSAGLGFGAYRKYAAGELTWKVAGAWTGVVGLFVAADYYLSS
jgi:hypothetical protein